jgi:hypothetical protein
MTVRVYRSTDASAPVLTGQAGSLTSLLDAVLVNGYGSATAAGWTIGYTTTNKRAYLQNLTGANNASGMYLYVDDTAPGAGGAKEARACGFETMSAITPVGTGQFPTSGQSAVGVGTLVIRKSATADSTARAWTIIANGQTIYLFIETGDQVAPVAAFPFVFGDFFSYKTSDSYAVAIVGRPLENTGSSSSESLSTLSGATVQYTLSNVMTGHYSARSWTGVGGSQKIGKLIDNSKMGTASVGNWNSDTQTTGATNGQISLGRNSNGAYFAYPNGPDGACWISPIWLNHSNAIRGYFKGLWAPLHDRPLNHGDTYTVSGGNLNGKSMIAQAIPAFINNAIDVGQIHVETSDTWT